MVVDEWVVWCVHGGVVWRVVLCARCVWCSGRKLNSCLEAWRPGRPGGPEGQEARRALRPEVCVWVGVWVKWWVVVCGSLVVVGGGG